MQAAGLLVQLCLFFRPLQVFLKELQSAGLQACNSKIGNNIITTLHLLIENGFLYLEKIVVLSYSQVFSYCLSLPVSNQAAVWIHHSG